MVYESLQHSLLALGLLDGHLDSVAQILCDWTRETEKPKENTILLTASLIAWRLLQTLIARSRDADSGADPLMTIIEADAEMLDTAGELFAASMTRLSSLRLDRGSRLAGRFCSTLQEWARQTRGSERTIKELIAGMRCYLKQNGAASQYAERLITRTWRS
jgi:hypothetical protein